MAEKNMTLKDFLLANPQDNIKEELFVSARFKEAGFPFEISAMTGEQYQSYQNTATAMGRHRKVNFDTKKFNELVVVNHTVNPNFKDANFIKESGCATPEQAMYKFLRAGEIVELSNKIAVLSGFDTDNEALVDEVKNS